MTDSQHRSATRRICAWCGTVVQEGPEDSVSHCICQSCLRSHWKLSGSRGNAYVPPGPPGNGLGSRRLRVARLGDGVERFPDARVDSSNRMPPGVNVGDDGLRDDSERVRQERDLYRRLLELGKGDELEPFLEQALALVVEVTLAKRGYLELRDPQSDEADAPWSVSFGYSEPELLDIQTHISRGIIAEALATGQTVVTQSALLDERFRDRESVRAGKIESVLCAPIGGNAALGVVYLEGRREPGAFAVEDRENAEVFALNIAPLGERVVTRRRIADHSDATRELRQRYALDRVVGRSSALAAALRQSMLAAPLDVTVLLTGQSGTGKTQIAQVIHANSSRSAGPFVEINCASLPETLIESELFGAKAGGHSEAKRDLLGKVAAAEGGTLFLDEVGELPPQAQAKLLQLLQSKQYYPLGANRAVRADIRLIAASNTDLERLVGEKRFRSDLFYRLNVLPVRLPALRERREDLRELAQTLCRRAAERHGLAVSTLSPAAFRAVEAAEWPGNVRQLENSLEAAAIRAAGEGASELSIHHVFPDVDREEVGDNVPPTFQAATRRFQRDLLAQTLEDTGWNVSEAARRLDLARSYVYELIRAFELERHTTAADSGKRGE